MVRFTSWEGWICQAYRFVLDVAPRQEQMVGSHAGARRFAWNLGLASPGASSGMPLIIAIDELGDLKHDSRADERARSVFDRPATRAARIRSSPSS